MHDIRLIREKPGAFDEGLGKRGLEPLAIQLLAIDDRRRAAIAALQAAQERRNALSKEIGQAKAAKDEVRAQALMAEVAALKEAIPAGEAAEKAAIAELDKALAEIPNLPLPDVPEGKDLHDNVEKSQHGSRRNYGFQPKQHFELGEALGLMDFETAAKLSGSRFVVLKNGLARLERALGQFMLDLHAGEHGYAEVAPPLLVRDDVMFGTAQLPKFENDQFHVSRVPEYQLMRRAGVFRDFLPDEEAKQIVEGSGDTNVADAFARYERERDAEDHRPEEEDFAYRAFARELDAFKQSEVSRFWLIPTAEVPLTNLVRGSILSEDELPLRFTALTPCFRAEAGAAGKDTRGMLRQHQFNKVELVSITTPEQSVDEHERMLACAEAVLKKLDLHYRVVTLCTGDMGFAAAKTYDIEVWLSGQGAYREVSSCSVCTDFQARRMNARYRAKGEKQPRFVHTLNGSGVAVGRALIAVMETYQNADGSVTVPSALAHYMGGLTRIEKL